MKKIMVKVPDCLFSALLHKGCNKKQPPIEFQTILMVNTIPKTLVQLSGVQGILCIVIFALWGCVEKTVEPRQLEPPQEISLQRTDKGWSNSVDDVFRKDPEPEPEIPAPRFKTLNPLDNEMVSISVVDESYGQVLQALAHAAALNLTISSSTTSVLGSNTSLTAEYQDMSVRSVLDAVCRMLNVAWHEDSGVLFIEPYVKKIIDLDFLSSVRKSSFEVGGDVLGSSSGGGDSGGGAGASPLSGNFIVEGETTATATDIYANIESSMEQLLGGEGSFVLNRQTGTLLVHSRPATVKNIEEYIAFLREKYQRQVLIEAKIIEVGLSKKHELGIDWKTVGSLISNQPLRAAGETVMNIVPGLGQDNSFYAMTLSSKYSDLSGIFHALEEFGALKILSNPRLKAMNGQSALISVGQSVSYLSSFQKTTKGTGNDRTEEISTEIGSVFDGVLLGVTPIIESDGWVSLHIVPIKSDLVELDTVEFGSILSPYQITLPRVNLREISTVTRVQSGDVVLLGGLIMDFDDADENGIPYLSDIPGVGRAFRYEATEKRNVELVIALKLKVLDQ